MERRIFPRIFLDSWLPISKGVESVKNRRLKSAEKYRGHALFVSPFKIDHLKEVGGSLNVRLSDV